jgi:phage regulator Rha-like protein
MSQNIIKVENQGGILVVDSRLIAVRLDIDHRSFLKTVRKYQPQVERRFGAVRFEIATREDGNNDGNQPTFAWLTKPQAEACMTFSRNTDNVVECKLDLVQAFNEAEQAYRQPRLIPVQQTIAEVDVLLGWIAQTDTERNLLEQAKYDTVANIHPEYRPLLEAAKKVRSVEDAHSSVGLTATQLGEKLAPRLSAVKHYTNRLTHHARGEAIR